jgi:hypothetical protein
METPAADALSAQKKRTGDPFESPVRWRRMKMPVAPAQRHEIPD